MSPCSIQRARHNHSVQAKRAAQRECQISRKPENITPLRNWLCCSRDYRRSRCIEIAGNPGNSITNCVEELCFQVCERFDIPAEQLVWLEHYDYDERVEWSMVTFGRKPPEDPFEEPRWITMTVEMWHD